MSGLTDLKQIRRSDLTSRSPSAQPCCVNAGLETRYHKKLKQLYSDPVDIDAIPGERQGDTKQGTSEHVDKEEEQIYDFRLFAHPSQPGLPFGPCQDSQRIALRSPSPQSGEAGLLNPERPNSYYFAGDTSADLVEQYQTAAVSGADILRLSKTRWQGLEMPWRVRIIRTTRPKDTKDSQPRHLYEGNNEGSKRKRNGKKRRIIIRKKLAERSAREIAVRQSQIEKEAAEREKRTRRNRQKKVKKKQKEKLKKSEITQDD